MDSDRFDEITRTLGTGASRRAALRLVAGAALGAALGRLGRTDAAAADDPTAAGNGKGGGNGTGGGNRKHRPQKCRAGFRRCGQRCCRIPVSPPPLPVPPAPPAPPPSCVSQPRATTCGGRICGVRIDNCGREVTCGTCPNGLACLGNGGCGIRCNVDAGCSGDSGCGGSKEGIGYCGDRQTSCGSLVCASTDNCPPGSVCYFTACMGGGETGRCGKLCAT